MAPAALDPQYLVEARTATVVLKNFVTSRRMTEATSKMLGAARGGRRVAKGTVFARKPLKSLARDQDCTAGGRAYSFAWSSIRPRLSSRPSTVSTSKMPGEVVRPVSAARSGWAIEPSFAPVSSA